MAEISERNRKRRPGEENLRAGADGVVGQSRSGVSRKLLMVLNPWAHGKRLSKDN